MILKWRNKPAQPSRNFIQRISSLNKCKLSIQLIQLLSHFSQFDSHSLNFYNLARFGSSLLSFARLYKS